jgi:diguanylate cyclase (GGDEF)-like protein
MAFALTHSLFVKGLASHILIISQGDIKNWSYIILQSAILLVSTPLMVFLINKRIKSIINFLNTKNVKLFLLVSLASFLTVFTLCFFVEFKSYTILSIIYFAIFFLLVSSYFLAYTIIHTKKSVDKLNILVYEDSLTKIKNRLALYDDFQKITDEGKKCTLYFLDLDKLKNINDTHGHLIGDKYIVAFTEAVKKCIGTEMEFYRISGDEFIIIDYINDNNNQLTIEKIQNSIEKCFNFDIEFQGVSIGKSIFPKETDNLDSLLSLADKRMYVEKSKIISN